MTVNPQNVLEQAKRYPEGQFAAVGEWDGLPVSFLYASNGTIICHRDPRPSIRVSRPISDFDRPEVFAGRFNENAQPAHDWLLPNPICFGVSASVLPAGLYHYSFGEEQPHWPSLLEQHLIDNLSIDTDDLDGQAVSTDLGSARKLFGADLTAFIEELLLATAA